jgi:hypothetical protein
MRRIDRAHSGGLNFFNSLSGSHQRESWQARTMPARLRAANLACAAGVWRRRVRPDDKSRNFLSARLCRQYFAGKLLAALLTLE